MWRAFRNERTGEVHAVKVPEGTTPHGSASDQPLAETRELLTCSRCLRFAFERRWAEPTLMAMIPEGELVEAAKSDRRCGKCGAPVSRCCC